jgi:NhaP-type Na+/H+ and K+/H+ antiporter
LRGAVGLALALIVTHSEVLPPEIGLVTVFNISGIVLLTLVINGTTTGFIIKSLGLKKESKVSQQMLAAILDQHDDVAKEIYLEYHNQEKHGAGTVDQIVEHVDIAKTKGVYDEVLQRMKRETARAKKELEKEMRL